MAQEELKMIERCQLGEFSYFAGLYDLYFKKIYDFIYFRTLHRETTEDLTSQVFFKILKGIGGFDISKGSFSSWLYQIARNTIIDHFRSHKKDFNIDDFYNLSTDSQIERDIDVTAKLDSIKKYLEKFKPEHREIVIMRLWDQLSYEEISTITGLSADNCKMIFSRVMSRVREKNGLLVFYLLFMIKEFLCLIK